MTTKEQNKLTMQKFLQFINTCDRKIAEEIIDDANVVFRAPTSLEPMHGIDAYVGVVQMMRSGMPDVQWQIEEIIAEDNKVMCRFTLTGTQSNPFFGVPATGKKVAVTAMNIYEFNEDGKIIREEGLPDIFSLLGQLGAFNK